MASSGAVTVRLEHDVDPVALGSRSGLLWTHGDLALGGVGEAMRIPVSRPQGAEAAVARLSEFTYSDAMQVPGSGAVGFAALPFDRSQAGELIVPEVVLGRGPNEAGGTDNWLTVFGDIPIEAAMAVVRAVIDRPVGGQFEPTTFDLRSVLTPEYWRDEVVAVARDRIQSGELVKAVLARELVLETDVPIDTALVVDRLRQTYRSAILFSVDGFVGASPELLVSRFGDEVRAHPLAGTAPRSSDLQTDAELAADLLVSTKDRWEHRITIDWLLDTLLPFCSYVDAEPEPTIVSLNNVHHLGTRVEGLLSRPAASALELVGALHPTPALAGDPQQEALDLIAELERAHRGRYGGPTGWVDASGNGAFAVSIRSAQFSGTETRFFAGVGVVADSDPEAELAETRSKFQAMLGALIRP